MPKHPHFQFAFFAPKYWGIWIGFACLRLIGLLPYQTKLAFGGSLGKLLYHIAGKRKQLVQANLKIAFPNSPQAVIDELIKQHFISLGIYLAETTINFWGQYRKQSAKNESQHFHFKGLENFRSVKNRGILLVIPHFTTIETTGLMLTYVTDFHPIYRKHDNPLMEYLITSSRIIENTPDPQQHSSHPLANSNTKAIIQSLKNNKVVWIAPDQKFTSKGSLNVPFFGKDAPSHPGICKLAKLTGAAVIPVFTRRIGSEYELTFKAPLKNFPSGSDYQDILKLHQLYEQEILENPSQYLWTHNRWGLTNKLH